MLNNMLDMYEGEIFGISAKAKLVKILKEYREIRQALKFCSPKMINDIRDCFDNLFFSIVSFEEWVTKEKCIVDPEINALFKQACKSRSFDIIYHLHRKSKHCSANTDIKTKIEQGGGLLIFRFLVDGDDIMTHIEFILEKFFKCFLNHA